MQDNKKSGGLGIAGFVLGLLSILLFQSVGIILGIIGLIFCIIQIRRNKTKLAIAGLILSIIGIIVGIVMIALVIIVWQNVVSTINEGKNEVGSASQCLIINLKINELNPNSDIIKITREIGKGDLDKIKVFLNGNPIKDLSASDMGELASREFSVAINSGDKVEIAPILKDGTICAISDSKTA